MGIFTLALSLIALITGIFCFFYIAVVNMTDLQKFSRKTLLKTQTIISVEIDQTTKKTIEYIFDFLILSIKCQEGDFIYNGLKNQKENVLFLDSEKEFEERFTSTASLVLVKTDGEEIMKRFETEKKFLFNKQIEYQNVFYLNSAHYSEAKEKRNKGKSTGYHIGIFI